MGRVRLVLLVIVANLAWAAPARAAVTIGSDLAPAPAYSLCSSPCLAMQTTAPELQLTAPFNAVIVSWQVRAINSGSRVTVGLRLLRPVGDGAFQVLPTGSSANFPTATDMTLTTRPTRPVRVQQGDQIGLSVSGSDDFYFVAFQTGNSWAEWSPPLDDGATAPPPPAIASREPLFNAQLEPDVDCDGRGDETGDASVSGGCLPAKAAVLDGTTAVRTAGGISLQIRCGAVGGDCKDNSISLVTQRPVRPGKAAGKKPRPIRLGGTAFSARAGRIQKVFVPLTKAGKQVLRHRRKASAISTITGGGGSSTANLTITTQGKKKKKNKKR